ncbi:MAG: (2Fe-2S)-binding protein [Gammaproteobacteria bacterium]|nr:(2Fe-2S)-binding protein [Gammaproteobacteria bacterium]
MFKLRVNGKEHELDVAPDTPLLWVLRDHLQLTGTKYGCGIGQCGACTVHVDGKAMRACQMPIASVGKQSVTTIEGLQGAVAEAVFAAWVAEQVPQCGYCQPGQVMSASALLTQNPHPDDNAITAAMEGNLCRCGTYQRIRRAIQRVARQGKGV